jgi:hypothetical protein
MYREDNCSFKPFAREFSKKKGFDFLEGKANPKTYKLISCSHTYPGTFQAFNGTF